MILLSILDLPPWFLIIYLFLALLVLLGTVALAIVLGFVLDTIRMNYRHKREHDEWMKRNYPED